MCGNWRKATLILLPTPTEREEERDAKIKISDQKCRLTCHVLCGLPCRPRSGCTCLAALRCIITTRSHIYVHPLSPLLPINKRAVPQRGEQGEKAVILSGLLLLLRCCCCCCFTSRSKEEPSDWATSLLRFDNFSTLGPLFLRLPTDAPFCISLLVSPFFRGVPDLPFQMHLVSV